MIMYNLRTEMQQILNQSTRNIANLNKKSIKFVFIGIISESQLKPKIINFLQFINLPSPIGLRWTKFDEPAMSQLSN